LQDLRHAVSASGEHAVHQRLVTRPVRDVDQRPAAARDGEQSGVDRGPRREARRGNLSGKAEFEPRPPLGGHHGGAAHRGASAGHLPLHEQHGRGPARTVQQSPQDRGGEVERQVAHDHVG